MNMISTITIPRRASNRHNTTISVNTTLQCHTSRHNHEIDPESESSWYWYWHRLTSTDPGHADDTSDSHQTLSTRRNEETPEPKLKPETQRSRSILRRPFALSVMRTPQCKAVRLIQKKRVKARKQEGIIKVIKKVIKKEERYKARHPESNRNRLCTNRQSHN
jgi:hypothetical protein